MFSYISQNPVVASLLISSALNIFFFIFAAVFKTDKVTDFTYSLTFFILAPLMYLTGGYTIRLLPLLITLGIMLWALRLGSYLFYRILKIGKDDRFDERRGNVVEFAKFWILQMIAVWVIMLPSTLFLNGGTNPSLGIASYIGIGLFIIGLLIEAISDMQKFNFKMKNRDHRMSQGLWKWSRHPNYLGEILVWWGLFIVVAPSLGDLQWIAIIGPTFITLLLLFVSGIPLLEEAADKKYGEKKEYRDYKAKTSLLILWPPKK
ncbi:MAG: DUF1295 domain-containing protein [Spirochaetaceae bacterium]|jgi:steroid 5-alpha reductase family enzyme|nr:DUF1295 domain-containing protein [Spirochaetaceae bacterium]